MKCTCGGRVDKKYVTDVMRCLDCEKSLYAVAGAWQLRAEKAETEIKNIKSITKQDIYNVISEHSYKYFFYDTLKETFSSKHGKSMSELDAELSGKILEFIKLLYENKEAK
jgi:hypothetical protein